MKSNRRISNCKKEPSKTFDCIMEFVVSKMNCSMEWEAKYYPNYYPVCQSVEDLKTYIELRKTIYKNEFKNELEHCFSTKCQENYATAELMFVYDEELMSYFSSDQVGENTSMFIFTKRTEMVSKSQTQLWQIMTIM